MRLASRVYLATCCRRARTGSILRRVRRVGCRGGCVHGDVQMPGGSRRLTFSKKKYSTTTNGTAPTRKHTHSRLARLPTHQEPRATAARASPHSDAWAGWRRCRRTSHRENGVARPCRSSVVATGCVGGGGGRRVGGACRSAGSCRWCRRPGSVSGTVVDGARSSGAVALGGRMTCAALVGHELAITMRRCRAVYAGVQVASVSVAMLGSTVGMTAAYSDGLHHRAAGDRVDVTCRRACRPR